MYISSIVLHCACLLPARSVLHLITFCLVSFLFVLSCSSQFHDWCVLSCLWDGAYKRTLAVNRVSSLTICDVLYHKSGAGRSSEVERSLMVRLVVGSILHGVDPLSYFSFQPVLHDWCNKGRGMCYPVCGMVHIKEPLLLIGKSSLCGGSGFPFSLSEWSLTICLTPYNRR